MKNHNSCKLTLKKKGGSTKIWSKKWRPKMLTWNSRLLTWRISLRGKTERSRRWIVHKTKWRETCTCSKKRSVSLAETTINLIMKIEGRINLELRGVVAVNKEKQQAAVDSIHPWTINSINLTARSQWSLHIKTTLKRAKDPVVGSCLNLSLSNLHRRRALAIPDKLQQ